jgi:hypothetical protein
LKRIIAVEQQRGNGLVGQFRIKAGKTQIVQASHGDIEVHLGDVNPGLHVRSAIINEVPTSKLMIG